MIARKEIVPFKTGAGNQPNTHPPRSIPTQTKKKNSNPVIVKITFQAKTSFVVINAPTAIPAIKMKNITINKSNIAQPPHSHSYECHKRFRTRILYKVRVRRPKYLQRGTPIIGIANVSYI